MSKKQDINKKVDEILDCLQGIHRASPQPFFYTRLIARMNKKAATRWERIASLIAKPAIAFATIALFLLVNIAIVFHFSRSANSINKDDSAVVSDNEYSLSVSSLYDINPK